MSLFTPSQGFRTLDWQSNNGVRTTRSVSGKTFRVKTGNQSWSFKLTSPALTREQFMADYSFFVQQEGMLNSFTIVPPTIGTSRGTADGSTITVNAAYAAGQSLVKANGGGGTLKKGDLIKFSNHDKVYMLTEDINMDASSEDFFNIFPVLTTAVSGSTTITHSNVPVKVFLDTNQIKFVTQADGLYRYEIVLNEDI